MDVAAESAYVPLLMNSTLLPMLLLSLARQKSSPNTANMINTEYDYVIVGGGSAGSVVAGRLSEVPCVSVLLLEAGRPPPLVADVPGFSRFFWNTDIDWQYRTVPQRYTGNLLVNREIPWPSGKTLGGSSVLSALLYARGNRQDYDNWAAEGAKGWSFDEVFPYFLKLEDNRDPEYVANGYHNVKGPQTVHRPRYQSELKDPFFKTIKQMGYRVVDPNGPRQTGIYDNQAFLRAGQRCSTAKAYLVPAENRTNLDILPNARVRKVVIKNRRAVGVEFDFEGSTYVVKARREVIMSAGTTNTAQLLMLSGIGPRKELERHKIPVVADLPVGQNLQDHCACNINFELRPDIMPNFVKLTNPANIMQYIQNRTGPLTASEFVYAIAFLRDGVKNPVKDYPNLELYFAEVDPVIGLQIGLTPQAFAQVYAPYIGRPMHTCFSSLIRPRSVGKVILNSTDPYDQPLIDPNYLDDPKDIEDIIAGLKICSQILTSPPMRKVGSVRFSTLYPGCEQFEGDEDDYFRCLVKGFVIALSHQVGTARMGDLKDPRTVVDPQLRVKYVKGLRVVDASVMPTIPTGNTNAPTMMVAEKASDIIKATIKCPVHSDHDEHWNEAEKSSSFHEEDYHTPESESLGEPEAWATNQKDDRLVSTGLKHFAHNENKRKMSTMSKAAHKFEEISNADPLNQEVMFVVPNGLQFTNNNERKASIANSAIISQQMNGVIPNPVQSDIMLNQASSEAERPRVHETAMFLSGLKQQPDISFQTDHILSSVNMPTSNSQQHSGKSLSRPRSVATKDHGIKFNNKESNAQMEQIQELIALLSQKLQQEN